MRENWAMRGSFKRFGHVAGLGIWQSDGELVNPPLIIADAPTRGDALVQFGYFPFLMPQAAFAPCHFSVKFTWRVN